MHKKNQIYFIANGPSKMGMSGGDKNFIEVAKELKKDGYEITVITNPIGRKIYEKEGLIGVSYILTDKHQAPINSLLFLFFWYIFRGLRALFIINNIVQEKCLGKRYFIVTSDFYFDTLSLTRLRKENTILIMNMLSDNPFKGYENVFHIPRLNELHYFLSNCLTFIIIKFFTRKDHFKIVATTELIRQKLKKNWFVNNKQIMAINCGVDYDKKFIDNLNKSSNKKYDFMWIGRNHPQKGVEDLKKIIIILKEKNNDFKMLIIGEICDELSEFRKKNQLEKNLFLAGILYNKSKFEVLSKAKIFLFTSHFESFGIVVLENMLVNNLVIGYDIESNLANFSKQMIFVDKFNYKLFAEKAVSFLIDYPEKKLVDLNQKFAIKFTWENTGREYGRILDSFN